MAEHVVQQGESLAMIARKYKLGDWRDIYNHPQNLEFRKKRPNPNIINPGDNLHIPDSSQKKVTVQTGKMHRFVVNSVQQKLKLKLMTSDKKPLKNGKVEFTSNGSKRKYQTNSSGVVEIDIQVDDPHELDLAVFENASNAEPDFYYKLQLNQLDTSDSISGIQARLNALGYPAGPVDGIMGQKTRSGIRGFQQAQRSLLVDGEPGKATSAALEREYGC